MEELPRKTIKYFYRKLKVNLFFSDIDLDTLKTFLNVEDGYTININEHILTQESLDRVITPGVWIEDQVNI